MSINVIPRIVFPNAIEYILTVKEVRSKNNEITSTL